MISVYIIQSSYNQRYTIMWIKTMDSQEALLNEVHTCITYLHCMAIVLQCIINTKHQSTWSVLYSLTLIKWYIRLQCLENGKQMCYTGYIVKGAVYHYQTLYTCMYFTVKRNAIKCVKSTTFFIHLVFSFHVICDSCIAMYCSDNTHVRYAYSKESSGETHVSP